MNRAAQRLGRKGGKVKSAAKAAAARRNAQKRWAEYRKKKLENKAKE